MFICLFFLAVILLGGYATQYVINTWGPILNKRETDISLFSATLLGLFVSSITIPVALTTWIIKKLAN